MRTDRLCRQLRFRLCAALPQREEGQSLAEYALILVLIALLAIAALTALGTNIAAILRSIAQRLVASAS
jgi:pilus assembly protein Flp/PilA